MTMNDSDNVKMTINIGGEMIGLTVPFNRQDVVRDAEKAASQLYKNWCSKWPKRSDKEIMAMVAYQFAFYYQELLSRYNQAAEIARQCDDRLSNLLGNNLPAVDED